MDIIPYAQNSDIFYGIASLILLIVVAIIDVSENMNDNMQRKMFSLLVIVAFVMNGTGLFHNIWLCSAPLQKAVSYDAMCFFTGVERLAVYYVAYLSVMYVLTIFRLQLKWIMGQLILAAPIIFVTIFYISGNFTDFFYYFDEQANLQYLYPQGVSAYICIILYFIFSAYLCLKYCRSVSTEKKMALLLYYLICVSGIPVRILSRSSAIFEFSFSTALLLCVYTFQNPGEFVDTVSGAGTKNALNLEISSKLLQKKIFTVLGVIIDRLEVMTGNESIEGISTFLTEITTFLKQISPDGRVYFTDDNIFMVIIPDSESDDPAVDKLADRIRRRFQDNWIMNGDEIRLFSSVFAVGFPDDIESVDKFTEVKSIIQKNCNHYRGIIRLPDLNMKYVEHDRIIDSLVRRALDDGLLEVYYQPIYNCKTGKYSSCEALLRLKDPSLGYISPAVFVPIAERNGCIISIDNYVFKQVCDMLTNTQALNMGLDYVEINMSVVDCIQTNLADNVISSVKKYGLSPEHINLEITETFEEGVSSVMYENMKKLRDYGISFSMDDLGTGYSNLSRIATLPMDIFKLDKSIIQQAFEEEHAYMVMRGMMDIIGKLGKEVVCEGVETETQARQLIKLGCDHIQGFFYARPMPKEQFLDFLLNNNN